MKQLAWKQVIVAFVLGGCVGVAVVWGCAPRLMHHLWARGGFQHRMLDRFSSKLHLSPAQRTRVAEILEAKRQKMDALRAEVRPKFEELRTSTSAEIRQLLSAEQQKTFDVMQAEWEGKKNRVRERWLGPGDHG